MTAELFEFPDEMRLVGIAAHVCQLCQIHLSGRILQEFQRLLEAGYPANLVLFV